MARRGLSNSTVRALAPVIVPLVTRVALPVMLKKFQGGRAEAEDLLDGAKDNFDRKLKRTRAEIDDLKKEAVHRGMRVYDEALTQGKELVDLLASRGLEVAQEWLEGVARPKRRRFRFGHAVLLFAAVGAGLYFVSRK